MQRRVLIFLGLILFLMTDISHAAPLIMRLQQMKAMKQRQAQGYQQQQQQPQGEQQPEGQQQTPTLTYQQAVDQRNQALAQAIADAHAGSVANQNLQAFESKAVSQVQSQTPDPGAFGQQLPASQAGSTDVKDVVDLSEVWKKLDTKSTVWTLLIDDQSKALTVSEYISRFQTQGVKIAIPPQQYVKMIDSISSQNPQMLDMPFGQLLQIMAIVNYDFDNGMNKDDLARKVLGDAGYEANKKRFSQPSQPSQQQGSS